jgi:ArsR family transcriptional regulator, arsenate/arsenite/antimonite-responsive transcriptional repressor
MKDAIVAFKAVGEETRFRALRLLVDAKVDLCACEIIDILRKPQYTISKALGSLVDASLVDERREGRMMFYSLLRSPVNDAIFKSIAAAEPDATMKGDAKRLASRLAEREDGACVKCG